MVLTKFKLSKSIPSLVLHSTKLYSLGTCYPGYRTMEFSVPLLGLLQLQSYLVPSSCISARIFTIPKLQNIHCTQFISELFSPCIEHLPNCRCFRPSKFYLRSVGDWSFEYHLSRGFPTELIFYLLRSIRLERLIICNTLPETLILETIVEWLQVSVS